WRQGALIQRKGLRRVALAHRELTEMIEDHGRRGALPERLIQREGLLETAVGLAWSPGFGVEPAENAQGRRLPPPVAGPPLETERPLRRGQPVPRLAGQGPRHPQLGEHAASLAEEPGLFQPGGGPLQAVARPCRLSQHGVQAAHVAESDRRLPSLMELPPDGEGLLIRLEGLLGVSLLGENRTDVVPGLRFRLPLAEAAEDLLGFVVTGQSLGGPAEGARSGAQPVEGIDQSLLRADLA